MSTVPLCTARTTVTFLNWWHFQYLLSTMLSCFPPTFRGAVRSSYGTTIHLNNTHQTLRVCYALCCLRQRKRLLMLQEWTRLLHFHVSNGTRTHDLLVKTQSLYQLSYRCKSTETCVSSRFIWFCHTKYNTPHIICPAIDK